LNLFSISSSNFDISTLAFELDIIFRDNFIIAINKPHGLLVHRTKIADEQEYFALQILRDQIGNYVYLNHRLDRKTAGVLLFALDKNSHRKMQEQFSRGDVAKKYLAIVRGYSDDKGKIDHPIKKENGKLAEALTLYKTIDRIELDIPLGMHKTSRYSLVEIIPKTGRMHQIRKHFSHINHPIIGDRPYGCNKQNKLFKERWGITTMMLHALQIEFKHPINDKTIKIKAPLQEDFSKTIRILGFNET